MARISEKNQVGEFAATVEWPEQPSIADEPILDASVGRLSISVEDQCVTAYRTDSGDTGDALTLPLYGVAEWIASNWWPLLFEPGKKAEFSEEADADFLSRHWLGYARRGMALPDLWFLPEGDTIGLKARGRYLRFARLTFSTNADASIPLLAVSSALTVLVESTLERLASFGISDTDAHDAWRLVKETREEERQYCQLVGSLGLSPYAENKAIDEILEQVSADVVDPRFVRDIFEASTEGSLEGMSATGTHLFAALPSAPEINLAPIAGIKVPTDRSPEAWRWGVDSAHQIRQRLGISEYDPLGGEKFFSQLEVDPELPAVAGNSNNSGNDNPIDAGISRDGTTAHVALVDSPLPQRRFSAVRSSFLGWSANRKINRLVTNARTRDQQASRAFAAEILAPVGYLRKVAHGQSLSTYMVNNIATELKVSPSVVKNQALNNHLSVYAGY